MFLLFCLLACFWILRSLLQAITRADKSLGTRDYFYFKLLEALNTDQQRERADGIWSLYADFKKAYPDEEKLAGLKTRSAHLALLVLILNRIKLLYYENQDEDAQKETMKWLAKKSNLVFTHPRYIDVTEENTTPVFGAKSSLDEKTMYVSLY